MSSLLDHRLIRTAAVEQVVAPIACHLCRLVLLCDSAEDPEHFSQLEEAAQAVAKASENLAAAASRRISDTEDEVLHMEMSSLLESVIVSGQHVLLAAQKLEIQSGLSEHREELVTATQNVFLVVVKVLLVDDDASVRRVVGAGEQVLERLSELGSSSDIKSLLKSFRAFSESLLVLHSLTVDRAHSLQDPRQTKVLLDVLDTLKKCISMLHTAMCATIKHPSSEQPQAAKRFILDKVQSTIADIIVTVKSDCYRGPLGSCGYYTQRRNNLIQLLTNSTTQSIQNVGFDSVVRDLVFHCMGVASSSRTEFQQRIVSHCRLILQFWSDIKRTLKSSTNVIPLEQIFEKNSSLLVQQIQTLDKVLMTTVFYQVLDTYLEMTCTEDELVSVIKQIIASDSSTNKDLSHVQPLVEDFISSADRIIQLAGFVSAVAVDPKSLENVENSRACLRRLRAQIASLSLELADNSMQTIQKLNEVCQKWEEETSQLQDALSFVLDVREFTSIGISEITADRHRCDEAYREQSYKLFDANAANLMCHMKLVVRSVRRHLDRSDNPIYRNGLLVLLKQVNLSHSKVADSVNDMLLGSNLNVEAYSAFTNNVSTVIQNFKVLREGLDGRQHPHLLSPLRETAREPDVSPVKDTCESNRDHMFRRSESPDFKASERNIQAEEEEEEEHTDDETIELALTHKYETGDLKTPGVPDGPKPTHKLDTFDLLPLLHEVVTVTKRKDVTALSQTCTTVLELSNSYVQAAKEALVIVDAVDCQTLESFRAELVSLTPMLIQTAQEMTMSSVMSMESIYKHSTQFSDLINNLRKVLMPVAGHWYRSVFTQLRLKVQTNAASVALQLNEVMTLCANVVQLLTSSDLNLKTDAQETFGLLHSKLNKAQNHTRCLVEFASIKEGQLDHLEGLCLLWGLSIQILLNSLDKIIGTSTGINLLSPKKQLSVLLENSLRIQEAARLTSLNCRSAYKAKQFTGYQNELKTVTDIYQKAAFESDISPIMMHLAKSEFFKRHLLITIKVLCGHLTKANNDYDKPIKNIVSIAYFAAEHFRESDAENAGENFESAAQLLVENVKLAMKHLEESLNYIRDPRTRSNLRSISDHLSFQVSDIISRARLIVETHYICDVLSLDVQIQCWAAKAHFVVEEIRKQDGIHQEAKEQIQAGLQGRTTEDISKVMIIPSKTKEIFLDTTMLRNTLAETNIKTRPAGKYELAHIEKHQDGGIKPAPSLTYTSIFLKQESDSWDPKDNRIIQVTRRMADTICYMTQYLRKKGPIPNKEAFVTAAKDLISNCQSVTHFIRVIANHCLDKQCTVELSLIVEQILTITNQLNIISSVNAVTPGCKSSDEILVKNAQNLLQTVLQGVRAAETACIKGLKQPEPNSDGAEATALCFQWKRKLEIHRAKQSSNPETDELGLRKTSLHPLAPSLAPQVTNQKSYK